MCFGDGGWLTMAVRLPNTLTMSITSSDTEQVSVYWYGMYGNDLTGRIVVSAVHGGIYP